MKKLLPIIVGLVAFLGIAFYYVKSRASSAPSESGPANPNLGTQGGATQVDMETH